MYISENGKDVKLPDFFIVGAAKSGTTSLFHLLLQNKRVFIPEIKEPFFFSFYDKAPSYTDKCFIKNILWKKEEYLKLYSIADEGQLLGDASTSYLYTYKKTISNIKNCYGNDYKKLKIVIILRNPVDRAFSHYTHLVRNGIEDMKFENAIEADVMEKRAKIRWGFDYLNYSMYHQAVKEYMDNFPLTKVFLFEDLGNPHQLSESLFHFLELDIPNNIDTTISSNPSGIPKIRLAVNLLLNNKIKYFIKIFVPSKFKLAFIKLRDSMMRKLLIKPQIPTDVRLHLKQLFAEDIQQLEKLINRDLSHWK